MSLNYHCRVFFFILQSFMNFIYSIFNLFLFQTKMAEATVADATTKSIENCLPDEGHPAAIEDMPLGKRKLANLDT